MFFVNFFSKIPETPTNCSLNTGVSVVTMGILFWDQGTTVARVCVLMAQEAIVSLLGAATRALTLCRCSVCAALAIKVGRWETPSGTTATYTQHRDTCSNMSALYTRASSSSVCARLFTLSLPVFQVPGVMSAPLVTMAILTRGVASVSHASATTTLT